MYIQVRGGSKAQKTAIRKLGQWLAVRLLGKRLEKVVSVRFEIIQAPETAMCGDTDWEEFEAPQKYPREFVVRLNGTKPIREFVVSLCHEMVHVKQFAKGDRKDYKRTVPYTIRWKNKMYTNVYQSIDVSVSLPWEVEAYGMEDGLYEMYLEEGHTRFHDDTVMANVYVERAGCEHFLFSAPGLINDDGTIKLIEGVPIRYKEATHTRWRHVITERDLEAISSQSVKESEKDNQDACAVVDEGADSSLQSSRANIDSCQD